MRSPNGAPPSPVEARHRSSGNFDDPSKKKVQGAKDCYKELDRALFPDKSSICKLRSLKFALVLIICGTVVSLVQFPADNQIENLPHFHFGYRSRISDVWTWDRKIPDTRYDSQSDVDWGQVSDSIDKLSTKHGQLRVALLNFNETEIEHWQKLPAVGVASAIHLDHAAANVTWEIMYPEWIDEEEESDVPVCPPIPDPAVPRHSRFDIVAVKLPCRKTKHWSRDVSRLHLQVSAAKIAALAERGRGPAHVLLVTECFPTPNLFSCKDLVYRGTKTWVYRPEKRILKEKLRLPVGSCELSIPLKATARLYSETPRREAYATILHSANAYVCGAIAAAQSIRMTGSTRDLVILVDDTISADHRGGLEAAGWEVRTIQRIRNPKATRDAYNEWNYSKFRLWQLTDYDRVVFIDADLLVLRNIDFLFAMPEVTATGNNGTLFNSGMMVIEPSNCTFQLLMDHIDDIESYNGGDQGYLNEVFSWWHRVPKHMNFLKYFWEGDSEDKRRKKARLFGADAPALYVVHYLGLKPWACFRDYDCNWNREGMREFASDEAHARWWAVHDAMPEGLRRFCGLRSKQKAALEWDRRQAERANYIDGHWRRKVDDERLEACNEELCEWESMLLHWGEPEANRNTTATGGGQSIATTNAIATVAAVLSPQQQGFASGGEV